MRIIVFSVGYTLCFGVVLAKTWRIYYIFNNPTMKKKVNWIHHYYCSVTPFPANTEGERLGLVADNCCDCSC